MPLEGPMKGVILTPDIAKIFHPTPDIKAKKCPTPTLVIILDDNDDDSGRPLIWNWLKYSNYTKLTLDTVIFRSTPETVKYLTTTLDTDPPFQGPY